MNNQIKNISASIYSRLGNEAKKLKKTFGEILQHYGMERFLYRLSQTKHVENLILKGGLIFTFWDLPLRRPTRDIDFLGVTDKSNNIIYEIMREVMLIEYPEDGVLFDTSTIKITEKQVDAGRKGLQATFTGYLGKIEIPMHIDIGFSDEIEYSINMQYPTILKEVASPIIIGYPPEFVVAEKFHTIQRFVERPSRWKDYYDIWLISERFEFEDNVVERAISMTFKKRSTTIPNGKPKSLSAEFSKQYDSDWKRFLTKNDLENIEVKDFLQVNESIWSFIGHPINRINSINTKGKRYWRPQNHEWL